MTDPLSILLDFSARLRDRMEPDGSGDQFTVGTPRSTLLYSSSRGVSMILRTRAQVCACNRSGLWGSFGGDGGTELRRGATVSQRSLTPPHKSHRSAVRSSVDSLSAFRVASDR